MTFPEKIIDREKYILDRVVAGSFEAKWTEVSYTHAGKNVKLKVMEDALKIDGVRVNVSARLQQNIADVLDASLMTAQVADIVYVSSVRRIDPAPMPIASSVAAMVKHSSNVDARLKPLGQEGLVSDPGKHWILDKKLESSRTKACNYGWHFLGPSYLGIKGFAAASKFNVIGTSTVKVIQPNATAHDWAHSDYSQICQLVSQQCWVDDVEKKFSELLTHPTLCILVSSQGQLKITRQPGIPEIKPSVVTTFPSV